MKSLRERLEAISRGEIKETGGAIPALPVFHDEEMKRCATAIYALIEKSKRSTHAAGRLHPPPSAVHVIL